MKIYRKSNVPVIINSAELVCPFCKDVGFDLAGLKSHLIKGDCEAFNNTENLERLMWESEPNPDERDEAGFEREQKE